ncbi:2-phosphosulfolactate phosphatase [Brevibacillus sp. B_LB10_24]|jgi:2-phosphosulfolactate phosphatase|uniref:2-phosphosulfolactate phosphatase n=1 Tax=Brevibacillus TaxID=55080 RepID=UPI0002D78D50|nr:2-phosphosulfolactate phosphatase [Brevibacillus massiliensis]
MRVEVVGTVEEIRHEQIRGRIVVVIDVLRCASTIVTALGSGFSQIVPVETIGQANALRGEGVVLAGERYCKKIADFDYSNSPTQLNRLNHAGKTLVLTTTNGTRAIQKAERAEVLMIGCFLNASACVKKALDSQVDITLYCAGTRQVFALEDGLAAGCMVSSIKQAVPTAAVSDLGEVLAAGYLHAAGKLPDMLFSSVTGRRLVQHNCVEDIRFCSQVDLYPIVPVVKEKRILPSLVS